MEPSNPLLFTAMLGDNDHSADSNGSPFSARAVSFESSSTQPAWQVENQPEDSRLLRDLLAVVRRRAGVMVGVATVVMTFVVARSFSQVPLYEGTFQLLVEQVNADADFSDLSLALGPQNLGTRKLDYETQAQVLRSPSLIEPVAEQLRRTYPTLSYLSILRGLKIARLGDTKILEVSYISADPVRAQAVLEALSKEYLSYSLESRQTSLSHGINFIEEQLPALQTRVDTLQAQMEVVRRQYEFVDPQTQAAELTAQESGLADQQLSLDRARAAAQHKLASLQASEGALTAVADAPTYQQLVSQVRSVELAIAKELTRFEPDNLAIQVLEEERKTLLPLLQQEAQRALNTQQAISTGNLEIMNRRREDLAQAQQQVAHSLDQLPSLMRQYSDLQRELETSTAALTRLRATQEALEIGAAQTESPWRLLEAPEVPTKPVLPDLKSNLLKGFVASLILGLIVALILEKLDNVYHSVDDLKAGTNLPLLGVLPFNRKLQDDFMPRERAKAKSLRERIALLSETVSRRLFDRSSSYGYAIDSDAGFLEALRVLHTSIHMLSADRWHTRSIAVSSALPGDGKSTVSVYLAQVATAIGQRVLVVDGNLRQPQMHERLAVSNEQGLSNLITEDLAAESVIQQVDPNYQLFVLTAGKTPPDSTRLLGSQKMRQLMATFARSFDLVIYDMPTATGLADVSLVGQNTDGLLLVSRLGKTDRTVLAQTIEALRVARISILGMVANGVKPVGASGYRNYAYPAYADAAVPDKLELSSSKNS